MTVYKEQVHLVSCIGIDRECNYLPHFIAHYRGLGVPARNFYILLNTTDPDSTPLARAKKLMSTHGLPEPEIWIGPYSSQEMWRRRRELQAQMVPPEHWVLGADADEFHEYPDDLVTILSECESRSVNCIQGPMVDRLASNGELAAVPEQGSIWDAFPVEANVVYLLGQIGRYHGLGGSTKVMALKGSVFPRPGGHRPYEDGVRVKWLLGRNLEAFPELAHPTFRFSIPLKVHHFKWTASLLAATLAKCNAVTEQEQAPAALEYNQKIVSYFERHGKVGLTDVPMRPAGAYVYRSWRRRIAYLRARDTLRKAAEKSDLWAKRLRRGQQHA